MAESEESSAGKPGPLKAVTGDRDDLVWDEPSRPRLLSWPSLAWWQQGDLKVTIPAHHKESPKPLEEKQNPG